MYNQGYKLFTLYHSGSCGYNRWIYWHSFKSKSYGIKRLISAASKLAIKPVVLIEHYYIDKHGKHHIDVNHYRLLDNDFVEVSLSDIKMYDFDLNCLGVM